MALRHRTAEERRDSIAEFIQAYVQMYGYAPTIREIADNEVTSLSNCYRILQGMIRDGEMRAVAGKARTWRLVDPVPF